MSLLGVMRNIASLSLSSRHHDRRDNSDSVTTRAWALSADPQGTPVVRVCPVGHHVITATRCEPSRMGCLLLRPKQTCAGNPKQHCQSLLRLWTVRSATAAGSVIAAIGFDLAALSIHVMWPRPSRPASGWDQSLVAAFRRGVENSKNSHEFLGTATICRVRVEEFALLVPVEHALT